MSINREKVQFQINTPQIVTLSFNPPSEPRPGNWGDQYMYWLEEEKTLWADESLHVRIKATGARAGDHIMVTKRKDQARHITWSVAKVTEAELARARAALDAGQQLADEMPRAAPPATIRRLPASKPIDKRLPAEKFAQPGMEANNFTSKPVEKFAGLNPQNISGNLMQSALQQAIEACNVCEFHATSEDVRALAITIFIQASGGAKR